jgi:prepilin-type N-terminal cleavage/methylation domain-containing protein
MSRVDLRSESGFTLVELLVAMSLGLVVSTALMAMVIVSIHFSSQNQDRVDANQQGRLAMQRIVQALDSSCVAASTPPIVGSATNNGTSITFYSNTGSTTPDQSTVEPSEVTISLTGGALVMQTATWKTGTSSANWTFNTPTSFTLLAHAAQTGSTPVFQYFGYASGGAMNATPYTVPLSAANAATTAMVQINFEALPSDNYSANNRGADFQNQIVLRLTPASGASSASNTPCT